VLLILLLSVLVTSFISGIFGMAGGMILMGILLMLMPVADAMIIHGISQMAANGIRAIMLLPHVYWRGLIPYVAGAGVAAIGMFMVAFIPSRNLVLFVLGLLPFLMLLPKRFSLDFTRLGHAFFCGVVVSICQLTAGVSGTVLDLFFTRTKLDRFQIVATKSLTQTFSHGLKLVYFGSALGVFSKAGWINETVVVSIVICAIVGSYLGKKVLVRLSDRNFHRYTAVLIFMIGMIYLFESLRQSQWLRELLGW